MIRGALLFAFSLLLSACSRHRDFTLPLLQGASEHVTVNWRPEPNPVLTRGTAGEWDSVDALNPSVILNGSKYINYYSGFDGKTWHTGVAVSANGLVWQKQGPILSPDPATWEGSSIAANGSAIEWRGEILYFYQAGDPVRIGLARQTKKSPTPVLETGPRGSWDERGVADPYAVAVGNRLYLFYLGMDRAGRQRLGVAESNDGMAWYKLRSNPILELGDPGSFDENGLGEPAVWTARGSYWMLYTGRDRSENRRLGIARSRDGVHWEKLPKVISGEQPWDSKVICDPTVIAEGDRARVWFGGGDVARPDQNIHGEIGYGVLQLLP